MTREESFELLGVPPDAGADAIRARMRELYSEYQLRLTNAPTTNLKLTYQRNLAELDEAGRTLLGADASLDEIKNLPVAEPAVAGKVGSPKSSFTGREERDCPHCGEKILAKATRCRHCGQAVVPVGAAGGTRPTKASGKKRAWLLVLPVLLAGIIGGLAYRFGLPRRDLALAASDTSRVGIVSTKRDSVMVPQNVATVDTTRLTPPQRTRKDSVRVNPSVVRRDTAKPTPVVRRDTAKAPTVVTPTVTQRKDHGGYGPYRWGMTVTEVRTAATSRGIGVGARWTVDGSNHFTLRNADGLRESDLLRPFFQCDEGFLTEEVEIDFYFDQNGGLRGVEISVDRRCPGTDELYAQLISRYGMVRSLSDTDIPVGSEYMKSFYKASDDAKKIEVWRGGGSVHLIFSVR